MNMPTENRSNACLRRPFAILAVCLCIGTLLLTFVAFTRHSRAHRQLPAAVRKLRDIENAIAAYCEQAGHLPHDPRGQEFALYRLHPFVSADVFQLVADDITMPYWDHDTRQLRGGDVLYLNQPNSCGSAWQLFLIAIPKPRANGTYAAYLGDGSQYARFADTPDQRVLGSFRTADDLHVIGRDLFHEMSLTHVVSGSSWTIRWDEHGLQSAIVAGRHIKYRFNGGRLHTCLITTKDGTVTESFRTDNLGQIVDVTREPENWRMILGVKAR